MNLVAKSKSVEASFDYLSPLLAILSREVRISSHLGLGFGKSELLLDIIYDVLFTFDFHEEAER